MTITTIIRTIVTTTVMTTITTRAGIEKTSDTLRGRLSTEAPETLHRALDSGRAADQMIDLHHSDLGTGLNQMTDPLPSDLGIDPNSMTDLIDLTTDADTDLTTDPDIDQTTGLVDPGISKSNGRPTFWNGSIHDVQNFKYCI